MSPEEYLVSEINKHLKTAPETSYTKEKGREFSFRNLLAFLYHHALEDATFDNYNLIQVVARDIVGKLLDTALSALCCVCGDTDEGEDMYEWMKMSTAHNATQLLVKFECHYPDRAILNELKHGGESRWVNVPELYTKTLNLLQGDKS